MPAPTPELRDAEDRAVRQRRLADWRELRTSEVTRAKRILEDPNATSDEKKEAKILLGAYAIDPVLMLASGSGYVYHASQGTTAPGNRHPRTPSPPSRRTHLVARLSRLMRLIARRGT